MKRITLAISKGQFLEYFSLDSALNSGVYRWSRRTGRVLRRETHSLLAFDKAFTAGRYPSFMLCELTSEQEKYLGQVRAQEREDNGGVTSENANLS